MLASTEGDAAEGQIHCFELLQDDEERPVSVSPKRPRVAKKTAHRLVADLNDDDEEEEEEEEPAQQKETSSSILPDWVRRAQLVDSAQAPQPPQQQQQQCQPAAAVQQQQHLGEPIDVFVSRFLRNQPGLDLALVVRAVARYFKLNPGEKESFRAMMLDLAEAPSVEALQAFLEGMVEQH